MENGILIVCHTLAQPSGSSTAVRDLAIGLTRAGRDVTVYSPRVGIVSDQIRDAGVRVAAGLAEIDRAPAIVHGHHAMELVDALTAFPHSAGVFTCHDRFAWHSMPPFSLRLRRYIAVDLNCRERLVDEHGISAEQVVVILNTVDTQRFPSRGPLPPRPKRALVFSNYAGVDSHLPAVRIACASLEITLDVAGSGTGSVIDRPELLLGRYDIVFAKAKCALEAMAVGAAVVLCDARGLGPMVTSGEVERLRQWNFGMRLLERPLEPDLIAREIARYDPDDAARVRDFVRQRSDSARSIEAHESLYDGLLRDLPGSEHPGELTVLDLRLLNLSRRLADAHRELNDLELWRRRLNPLLSRLEQWRQRRLYTMVVGLIRRARTMFRRSSR